MQKKLFREIVKIRVNRYFGQTTKNQLKLSFLQIVDFNGFNNLLWCSIISLWLKIQLLD